MTRLLCTVLLLVGCAGPMQLAKDGAGQPELQNDAFDCKQQWNQSAAAIAYRIDPLANLHALSEAREYMRACMVRKGWNERP